MELPKLKIGHLVSRLPIIQGGMGVGISLSGLASAVANEGGIGVIAGAMIGINEPDIAENPMEVNIRALKKEIRQARKKTAGLIGVNIMVALTHFAELVKTAIDEGIDFIFTGAGLPLNLPKFLKQDSKTKLVPIVSSGRAARLICTKWISKFNYLPDAFVVEGPKAGGHLGLKPDQIQSPDHALESILPDVLEAIRPFEEKFKRKIPVIPAGGIYSGEDIRKYLSMGAAGVQMGTRFVATHECDADVEFKKAYVNARKEDMVIVKSPVGLPGRAIRTPFVEAVENGAKKPFRCPYHCISTCKIDKSPYCIAIALNNARQGKIKQGLTFAGANAWRVDSITSVKEIFQRIKQEFREACQKISDTYEVNADKPLIPDINETSCQHAHI